MRILFIDFSMLGYYPEDCIVLDCSVGAVETDKMLSSSPYSAMDVLRIIRRFKFDIASQKVHGSVAHQSGIDFWRSQSSDMIDRVLKPSTKDVSVATFSSLFIEYLITTRKIDSWWSWRAMDDAAILWRLFRMVGRESAIREYLPRHKARDLATFIDAKFGLDNKKLGFIPIADVDYWNKIYISTDSTAEVMANVMRMQAILRAENDLSIPQI